MGRLVTWAARSRLAVLGATLLLAALALLASRQLELDALPDVTGSQVIVLTQAPGLTPKEIERSVTRPVEMALNGVPGLVEQRSLSRYGISSVTAVFDEATDPWLARQVVDQRIRTLDGFPEGVGTPELAPHTGGLGEILQLSVTSSLRSASELSEFIELELAPVLGGTPGVVEINVWGGRRRSLDLLVDPLALARHGLTLSELAAQVRESVGAASGSTLEAGPGQTLLRAVHWPVDAAGVGAITITTNAGLPLRVADVARVQAGALPRIGAATRDGKGETVYVMVQMLRDANALQVLEDLHGRLEALNASLPEDIVIDVVYDRAELVGATLRTIAKNLLEGASLVILVLFFMLGSVRAGLLVASIIPLSMLGAVAGMVLFDLPGNLMSLGAIDFGLLVDGAVVMVERVFHEFSQREVTDESPSRAREDAIHAMRSVARPMATSVGIIVLVYVPILTLSGVDGRMFRPMAATVVLALIASLLLSLTFIPAVASRLRPKDIPRRTPWLPRLATRLYTPSLEAAMRRPAIVAAAAVALLALGGLAFAGSGTAFVPQLDEGDLVIQTNRAADISIETSAAESMRLESAVLGAAPEVLSVTSRIGSPEVATDIMGLEQADVFVDLAPRAQWRPGLSREALIEAIATAIERDAPGAAPTFTQPIQMRFNEILGGSVTDVSVSLYGENSEELDEAAQAVLAALRGLPGVVDLRIMAPPAVSMVELRPRLLELASVGMSPTELLQLTRALRIGEPVGESWDGAIRVPIRLRLVPDTDAFTLEHTRVPVPGGRVLPLSAIAEIEHSNTPALVSRQDAQRRVVLGFNVRGADLGTTVERARATLDAEVELPSGVRPVWGGQFAQLEAARARLATIVPLVLIAIFVVLLLLFRRVGPAAIIFSNIPFAGVGGAGLLWLRGMPISISAAIGFIALSGIAILNGVVLMSTVLAFEEAGASKAEAARRGALDRMRPVLMTALVAALGFVPMAIATGVGAEVQRPLATVVVGGLLTSTLLSLIILPALYPWLSRPRSTVKPARDGRPQVTDATLDAPETPQPDPVPPRP